MIETEIGIEVNLGAVCGPGMVGVEVLKVNGCNVLELGPELLDDFISLVVVPGFSENGNA